MKLWHHVHVVNPDWHDAAKWYGDHTPIDNVSWEHSAHQHYKAEILRSGPNLVLMQRMQHADASDSSKIDSLGIAVDSLDAALATWTEGGGEVLSHDAPLALVADTWGMRLEYVETDAVHESAHHHVNIVAQNPDSLHSWYQQRLSGERGVFGFDSSREILQYDTYQLVFAQSDDVAADDSAGYRHYDHLGWFVEDLYGTCAALMDQGVVFPAHGLGDRPNPPLPEEPRTPAFAVDPSGIWFELVNLDPDQVQYKKMDMWD